MSRITLWREQRDRCCATRVSKRVKVGRKEKIRRFRKSNWPSDCRFLWTMVLRWNCSKDRNEIEVTIYDHKVLNDDNFYERRICLYFSTAYCMLNWEKTWSICYDECTISNAVCSTKILKVSYNVVNSINSVIPDYLNNCWIVQIVQNPKSRLVSFFFFVMMVMRSWNFTKKKVEYRL